MDEKTIIVEEKNAVGYLRLNRPQRLNSLNVKMHQVISSVLTAWAKDTAIRAVVLTAEGRGFCAGQDLNDRVVDPDADAPDLGLTLEKHYNPLIKLITEMPKPVICAVNGVAAGAGANIALACDIVIAARSASFIQAFCRLGLIPDSGGTWFLPRLVGQAQAMGLAMLGDQISAERAVSLGMIWMMVEDDALKAEAEKLAEHLAKQPTYGLSLIKKAIHAAAHHSLDDQLILERDLQRLAGRSSDYKEGVQAFMQKRTPRYQGH